MSNPVVTIEMENGDIIKAELYPEVAPNTVNNFISLVKNKFYDGVIFHRVIRGFMIQGGDPQGIGVGGPGTAFPTISSILAASCRWRAQWPLTPQAASFSSCMRMHPISTASMPRSARS